MKSHCTSWTSFTSTRHEAPVSLVKNGHREEVEKQRRLAAQLFEKDKQKNTIRAQHIDFQKVSQRHFKLLRESLMRMHRQSHIIPASAEFLFCFYMFLRTSISILLTPFSYSAAVIA